jgi:hypothetical protein
MARLYYGIVVPYKEFVDKVIDKQLKEKRFKINIMKQDEKYRTYLNFLVHEYGDYNFDEDDKEEMENDPYTFLLETVDFFPRLIMDFEIAADLFDREQYVFVGKDFTPYEEDSLLPPKKQIPPDIKTEVKDMIKEYNFDKKPQLLIMGDIDISDSTESYQPKSKRLS